MIIDIFYPKGASRSHHIWGVAAISARELSRFRKVRLSSFLYPENIKEMEIDPSVTPAEELDGRRGIFLFEQMVVRWAGLFSENRDIHGRVPSNSKINIKKALLTYKKRGCFHSFYPSIIKSYELKFF